MMSKSASFFEGQASEHADEETADDFYEFMSSLTEFDLTGFLDEVV